MSDRRKLLKNLAGASVGFCFVNCSLVRAFAGAPQSGTTGKRRQIMLGGRRVRTIDIHAHCYVDLHDLIEGHPEALIPTAAHPRSMARFSAPQKMWKRVFDIWTSTESIFRP